MDLLQSFREFINREHLFTLKDRLLIAVSGGLDSVVLCELCYLSGFDFVIAHCNFGLRGDESDRDEAFVREIARQYGKEVLVARFETRQYATGKKVSLQVAARELRYDWFAEILDGWRQSHSPASVARKGQPAVSVYLLTAHHLDDNIETLLMNFFKGTGMAGLRAILPKQGSIVRPLLFAEKAALQQFARERQLQWVEDSSNLSDKYTRNYFRRQVIPLVEQVFPGAVHNLADNITRFREIDILYRQSVDAHKKKLLQIKGEEVHIPVLLLKKSFPLLTILYEIIRPFGFSPHQVKEVANLLDSSSGRYVRSASYRILRNRDWLILSPLQLEQAGHILIETEQEVVHFENGKLTLELISSMKGPWNPTELLMPAPASSIALLDAASVRFPLLLRKWRPGDYFYPLGLRKKKKLGRFFIDNKLSLADKEKVWVVEMDQKIVWVIGLRIDDRFKVTPATPAVLKIEFT